MNTYKSTAKELSGTKKVPLEDQIDEDTAKQLKEKAKLLGITPDALIKLALDCVEDE